MDFFLNLAIILILGVVSGYILNHFKLPRLLGYMIIGIMLGTLGVMNKEILSISNELRKIALIIILLKAGLSLDIDDLKKVGRPAIFLSILPCSIEMTAVGIAGHFILGLSYLESFLLGSVLGAVSPAVVVPRMLRLLDENVGTKKRIPQMIIAGSSMDDIIMMVFYTSFLGVIGGGSAYQLDFSNIPISIITGILAGSIFGLFFSNTFNYFPMRDSLKLVLIIGLSFFFVFLENYPGVHIGFSSLLSIIVMGIVILMKRKDEGKRLKEKCDKLWVVSEIFLFTLVGCEIKIEYAKTIFIPGILLIIIGMVFRSIGTSSATLGTNLNNKERLFVIISYLPKATVQAAIGGGLLDLGVKLGNQNIIDSGTIVLSVSVIAILFSAPLGATLMDLSYKKLLGEDTN